MLGGRLLSAYFEKFGKDMDSWVIRNEQRFKKQKTLISFLGK